MSELTWAETKAILLEVEQLFNRDDDIRDVHDVQKMAREGELHCANKLKDSKEIIKLMTSQVAAKEAEIVAPSQEAHSITLEKYMGDKENVHAQLESLRGLLDMKRENISKMALTAVQLREKSDELTATTLQADTRTSYALSLYTKVSNITWNYSVPPGKLAGSIGMENTKEVRPFCIETRSMTSYEVANKLWDMIGEGYDE